MRGSLSEFTLAELLQLFALSEKTGTITIWRDGQRSRLFLEAGRIAGWGNESFNVHEAMMQCELLPADNVSALEGMSVEFGQPGLAFIVRNLIEPYRWKAFVQRALEQDIYPVLNAEDGEIEMTLSPIPSAPVGVDISVQQLVLDGSRWEADMAALAHTGYDLGSVWERVHLYGEAPKRELSQLGWLVWSMLQQSMSIGDVASRICAPDLDTCHAVKRLASANMLDRSGD